MLKIIQNHLSMNIIVSKGEELPQTLGNFFEISALSRNEPKWGRISEVQQSPQNWGRMNEVQQNTLQWKIQWKRIWKEYCHYIKKGISASSKFPANRDLSNAYLITSCPHAFPFTPNRPREPPLLWTSTTLPPINQGKPSSKFPVNRDLLTPVTKGTYVTKKMASMPYHFSPIDQGDPLSKFPVNRDPWRGYYTTKKKLNVMKFEKNVANI